MVPDNGKDGQKFNPVIWKAQVDQGVTVSVTHLWHNGLNKYQKEAI
jgi:hypothetical protein